MNTPSSAATSPMQLPHRPAASTLASVSLAAVLTLAMLLGVNSLATSDAAAPQMAQAASTHA